MEAVNIRNSIYIHSTKIIALALFLCSSMMGNAQIRKVVNMPFYDDRAVHYGFQIGINSSRFRLKYANESVENSTIATATSPMTGGFSLGFVFNFRISDYLDARCLPQVSFYNREVTYQFLNDSMPATTALFETTFTEFPLLIKFKSERRGNLRLYMVGGIKPSIEVGAKKRQKKNSQLRTRTFDCSLEYGFGADIYFPLFKYTPELRFSLSLPNLLIRDPNDFSQYLQKMTPFTVSFINYFE